MTSLPLLLALLGTATEPGARIQIEKPAFDFGSVVFGERVSHGFAVRNQGEAPLLIREVTSSCGCLRADFDKAVPPGKSGKVEVAVDTTNLEGPVRVMASVRSNDPARRPAQLEIRGFVNGPIMLLPRDHLDVTTVAGEDQEQAVTLEVNRKEPLEVQRVESTSTAFAARLETTAPGRRYRIAVKFSGKESLGVHQGKLFIHTGDPKRAIIPLQCSLLVVSSVVAEPAALYLPPLTEQEARKGGGKRWKVALRNLRGRAFRIVSVRSELAVLQAAAQGDSHDIRVELLPNQLLRPGRTVSSLHVRTNLPDAQDVRIPVWIDVQ